MVRSQFPKQRIKSTLAVFRKGASGKRGLTPCHSAAAQSAPGYTERPPRPKGVKRRRPTHDFTSEAKALTVAVSRNGLLDRVNKSRRLVRAKPSNESQSPPPHRWQAPQMKHSCPIENTWPIEPRPPKRRQTLPRAPAVRRHRARRAQSPRTQLAQGERLRTSSALLKIIRPKRLAQSARKKRAALAVFDERPRSSQRARAFRPAPSPRRTSGRNLGKTPP